MLDLKAMLKAGIHFGHKTSRWSPKMRPYIWGARNNIHLIDIAKTRFLLERAGIFLKEIGRTGGSVLWIGTKRPAQKIVKNAGGQSNSPSVIHRWIGGTLTNFEQVKKAITRLLHLRDIIEKSLDRYGKKEQSMLQKELARLEKNVGGIIKLDYPPSVVVIVDAKKERTAIKEAIKIGVPIVAMVDTNTDPKGISFVIPSNDDSPRSITFTIDYLTACLQKGQEAFVKAEAEKKEAKEAEKAEKIAAKTSAKKVETKVEAKTIKAKAPEKKAAPAPKKEKIEAKAAQTKTAPKQASEAETKKPAAKVEAKTQTKAGVKVEAKTEETDTKKSA